MKKRVSVEVGRYLLKIASGGFDDCIKVEKLIDVPFQELDVLKSDNYNEIVLAELLQKKLKQAKLTRYGVNVVLSCIPNLLIREIVIPMAEIDEMYNIVKFEAKQFFPVNIDNYVIDFKVIEHTDDGKQRILVAALPKDIVERIINTCKKAKLKMNKIDIEANVISKLVNAYIDKYGMEKDRPYAVVNFERSFATAVVEKKGIIQIAKTFTGDFTSMLSAGEIKSRPQNQAAVEEICDNLSKFFNFYMSKERITLDGLFLIGELSGLRDIKEVIKVKTMLEILEFRKDFFSCSREVKSEEIMDMAVAAGGLIV